MPEVSDATTPYVHKTLGSLEAKADRAAADIELLRQELADLPAEVEAAVKRIVAPLEASLAQVRNDLADVQTTVNRWKAFLVVVAAISAGLGWFFSNFAALKRLISGAP